MLGKKIKFRIIFISLILVSIALAVYILLKSLEENVVYFLSPTDIQEKSDFKSGQKLRIGGIVKINSVKSNNEFINFIVTDLKNEIHVTYSGSIPNLFAEGKGVVAEGSFKDKNYFFADRILAKHDETYMPPKIDNNSIEEKKID